MYTVDANKIKLCQVISITGIEFSENACCKTDAILSLSWRAYKVVLVMLTNNHSEDSKFKRQSLGGVKLKGCF